MKRIDAVAELRNVLRDARSGDARIGLVPTMGFLHEGHLSLIDQVRARCDVTVMSIYVNPLQFGPKEDLARYPRDAERDARLAESRGLDVLFTPTNDAMYPSGPPAIQIVPTRMEERLCGAFRPGHFQGVLTVVAKLFNIVQPDVAAFGQKDFQQAMLIRRMVSDLDFPIDIIIGPIVRDTDGLAMSSRNVYLSPVERAAATRINIGLRAAHEAFHGGERAGKRLRALVAAALGPDDAVRPQYIELVDAESLVSVDEAAHGNVIAVAAFVGSTRLIDNVRLE